MHAKFCTLAPGDSGCCAVRPEGAPASWPLCLRIVPWAGGYTPPSEATEQHGGDLGWPSVPSAVSGPYLFPPDHRFGRDHVVIAVVDSHDDHILDPLSGGNWRLRARRIGVDRRRNPEIVSFCLGVRELADRLNKLPVAGVDRILRALN